MALIRCPECSKEISDMAASCPHCGIPVSGDVAKKYVEKITTSKSEEEIRAVLAASFGNCFDGIEKNKLSTEDAVITLEPRGSNEWAINVVVKNMAPTMEDQLKTMLVRLGLFLIVWILFGRVGLIAFLIIFWFVMRGKDGGHATQSMIESSIKETKAKLEGEVLSHPTSNGGETKVDVLQRARDGGWFTRASVALLVGLLGCFPYVGRDLSWLMFVMLPLPFLFVFTLEKTKRAIVNMLRRYAKAGFIIASALLVVSVIDASYNSQEDFSFIFIDKFSFFIVRCLPPILFYAFQFLFEKMWRTSFTN